MTQRRPYAQTTLEGGPSDLFFSFAGAPRTKKTHNRLVRAGRRYRVLPSQQYEQWQQSCASQAFRIKDGLRGIGIDLPITDRVTVRAVFFRDRNSGDECGYMQALGDVLQDVGIIEDDRQIHWCGIRLTTDRESPRVEVQISL